MTTAPSQQNKQSDETENMVDDLRVNIAANPLKSGERSSNVAQVREVVQADAARDIRKLRECPSK